MLSFTIVKTLASRSVTPFDAEVGLGLALLTRYSTLVSRRLTSFEPVVGTSATQITPPTKWLALSRVLDGEVLETGNLDIQTIFTDVNSDAYRYTIHGYS